MSQSGLLNFFAGISSHGDEPVLDRVMMESDLQRDITELFNKQADDFLKDDFDRITFDPKANYRLERGQVFVIKGFSLSANYLTAVMKPHQCSPFSMAQKPVPMVVTILGADASAKNVNRLLFQQFRSPQMLDKRFSMWWSGNVFNRVSNDGITLAHELAAVWQGSNLYFRSFAIVSRFFDLAAFEPRATTEEISTFVASDVFAYDDDESQNKVFQIIENDDFLRRRVASILSREILSLVKPRTAANKALEFGITIPVRRPDGKDKIGLPTAKKELKSVVRFLNEEYFHGELSNQLLETNSLRRHTV
jgi:hypothetical protein